MANDFALWAKRRSTEGLQAFVYIGNLDIAKATAAMLRGEPAKSPRTWVRARKHEAAVKELKRRAQHGPAD